MAVLKVKDPTTGEWLDIAGTGTQGPPGGPVPVGGLPGEVIVKTGLADMEVGWTDVGRGLVGQLKSDPAASIKVPTANTFTNILTGDITFTEGRMYQFYAGLRCISDAGTDCNSNVILSANGVTIFDDYFTVTGATVGLWGSWCQQLVLPSSDYTAAGLVVPFILKIKLSLANLFAYYPRITIIDVGSV